MLCLLVFLIQKNLKEYGEASSINADLSKCKTTIVFSASVLVYRLI